MRALVVTVALLAAGPVLAQPSGTARVVAAPDLATVEVSDVLNRFHRAAARADASDYFGLFAPDAVFIGTAASERWTVDQFRAYAEPHFSQGKGWLYVPRERHVAFSGDGRVAWFDELLDSPGYGTSRGTGVLVKTDAGWRLAQYALTFPIPNELAKELTTRIKTFEAEPK